MAKMKKRLLRCPTRSETLAVLLILAVCITVRSWLKVAENSGRFEGRRTDEVPTRVPSYCYWNEETGAVLFRLTHHKQQATKGGHWFHVAEHFTSRRADLEVMSNIMGGNRTVYLQVLDATWMASLTPMTRLLVSAGVVGAGVDTVRFVDSDQARLCFTPGENQHGQSGPSLRGDASEGRKGPATTGVPFILCSPDEGHRKPNDRRVGWLRRDDPGAGSEFVVSRDQPVSDRFWRSAVEKPAVAESRDGGLRAREATGGDSAEAAEDGGVCVKVMGTIGGPARARADWFGLPGSALSLRVAVDALCPISWLRERGGKAGGGDGAGAPLKGSNNALAERGLPPEGHGGSTDGGCMPGTMEKRLLVYQRDRNRKIMDLSEVVADIHERLGPYGWTIETMIHSDDARPCDVVDTIAGVDVLVTAHGFQVRRTLPTDVPVVLALSLADQSMLAVFMRPGSLLFEIFPHKYFKAGYQPMAAGLGIRYGYARSRPHLPLSGFPWPTEEACMGHYWCRWYARLSNVDLSKEGLASLVDLALGTKPCGKT